jgi:hypothetical protein
MDNNLNETVKRKPRIFVQECDKDYKYWEKRNSNTIYAKKSRHIAKTKNTNNEIKLHDSLNVIEKLKKEIEFLTNQNEFLTNQNEILTNQNEILTNRNEILTNRNEILTNRNELLTSDLHYILYNNLNYHHHL